MGLYEKDNKNLRKVEGKSQRTEKGKDVDDAVIYQLYQSTTSSSKSQSPHYVWRPSEATGRKQGFRSADSMLMYSKLKEKNKAEKGEIKRRVKRSKNDYE